jgi:hypothetical protein
MSDNLAPDQNIVVVKRSGVNSLVNKQRIPKILHYCFGFSPDFGGKPFGLSHWACIKSAVDRLRPDRVFLYYEFEPNGPWWRKALELIEPIKITAPREIFGHSIEHPAHRSDITRLEKLIEMGGIYLDTDVFVHRSFDHLLMNSTVLGREGDEAHDKLCNAVILAEPGAPFLKRWYEEYKDFRGQGRGRFWNEHSVQRPGLLARQYPDEITIISNRAFFWPLFFSADLAKIFKSTESIIGPETLATHLWENQAWRKYLELLTPGAVRQRDGNFNSWVRPMVADLDDNFGAPTASQHIRNWIGRCEDVRVKLVYKVSNLAEKLRSFAKV